MLKEFFKMKFATLALGALLIVSGCNSGSKDKIPAVNDNSVVAIKADSATIVPTGGSAKTTKSNVTESANVKTENQVVTIENMKFNPASIAVNKGEQVTFINKDIVAHNATETKNAWESPLLANGQSWTFTPEKTSDYYCTVHVVMNGKIIVK